MNLVSKKNSQVKRHPEALGVNGDDNLVYSGSHAKCLLERSRNALCLCGMTARRRRAASVIEISLAITLAVIVLFIALGIFGGNLRNVLSSTSGSNMKNIWSEGYGNVDNTWTRGAQSSNMEIEVTAELDLIFQQAKAIVDSLSSKPNKSNKEKYILAESMTIMMVAGPTANSGDVGTVDAAPQSVGYTTINGLPAVNWKENNPNYTKMQSLGDPADLVVENCRAIKNKFSGYISNNSN